MNGDAGRRATWAVATLVAGLGLGLPASSPAAHFTVDTEADAIDVAPADGLCADAAGQCSLRAAVMESNALVGADRVTLGSGPYEFTRDGDDDDALRGDLDVLDDLEVSGPGVSTAVDAAGLDRAFEVPSAGVTLELSGLTVTGGDHLDIPQDQGGGIRFVGGPDDRLELADVRVTQNRARRSGGGIYAEGSGIAVSVDGGSIDDNDAGGADETQDGEGGGIYVSNETGTPASLDIADAQLEGNQAGGGGSEADGWGGAVWVEGNAAISVDGSEVTGNGAAVGAANATGQGGALFLSADAYPSSLRVADSTLADNAAGTGGGSGDGGAIFFTAQSDTATLEVERSTFSGNDAGGGDAASTGRGGAIFTHASLSIEDSTLTGNRAGTSPLDGGQGGAVFMNYNGLAKPSIDVVSSVLSENSAGPVGRGGAGGDSGRGGAIFLNQINDDMRIVDSQITGNAAYGSGPSGSAQGGGIYFFCSADPNSLDQIVNSTVRGNVVDAPNRNEGAGVWMHVDDDVEVDRSLIAQNHAGSGGASEAAGGGMYLYVETDGATDFLNSTITDNLATAAAAGGASFASGGGLFLTGDTTAPQALRLSTLSHNRIGGSGPSRGGANLGSDRGPAGIEIASSIISDGSGPRGTENCAAPDGEDGDLRPDALGPAVISGGGSVEDTAPSQCGLSDAAGDLVGVNPLLGPLADNGGTTFTRALVDRSPALGGPGAPCVSVVDQRGAPRPQGAGCDAGAYEGSVPDTFAPETKITAGPRDRLRRRRATFRLEAAGGGTGFECKLDHARWRTCSSHPRYRGLPRGRHVFRARASDAAGNTDATPATRRFEVVKRG